LKGKVYSVDHNYWTGASRGLRGVMRPSFICWLRRYIHCLRVYLASTTYILIDNITAATSLLIFPYLRTSLLTFFFEIG